MRTIVIISFFFFICPVVTAQKFIPANQQWAHYYSQFEITPKIRLGFDAGFRTKNEFKEPSQYLARISFWRKVNSKFFYGGGFVHSGYFDSGLIRTLEFRPYQEIQFTQKVERSLTQIRFRLEERFFLDYDSTDLNQHRFVLRNRLLFSHTFFLIKPIKKMENSALMFFVGDELFLNVKSNDVPTWFDQNRLMAGPIFRFNERLSLQFLYNLQIAPIAENESFRMTHVFWISFRQNFNLVKTETTEQ